MTDLVPDEEIHAVVFGNDDPQKMCDVLVKKANSRGGHDNISVIIAEFDEHVGIFSEKTEIKSDIRIRREP